MKKIKQLTRSKGQRVFKDKIEDYKEIGAYLRSLRKRENLTQEKCALLLGVSARYISEIERGKRKIDQTIASKFIGLFTIKRIKQKVL